MEDGIQQCGRCGTQRPAEETFCGACGAPLTPADRAGTALPCPRCGKALTADERFCGRCGEPIDADARRFRSRTTTTRPDPVLAELQKGNQQRQGMMQGCGLMSAGCLLTLLGAALLLIVIVIVLAVL